MNLHINTNTNLTLLKKNKLKILIISSDSYYIKYFLNQNVGVHFNPACRTLVLKLLSMCEQVVSKSTYSLPKTLIKGLSSELTNYSIKKITFSGKSYKIKKCVKSFSFEFNKAHLEVLVWTGYFLKKLKKSTILLKGINLNQLQRSKRFIVNIKKSNPFTLRGLRENRCVLKRKQGKKTS